ncbi:hypothetical protein HYS54_04910, partial [Candidatus Micrarchaeota archaeon]|nr:hypothetical protein [Candidatus Micrarchaeota archaeon]
MTDMERLATLAAKEADEAEVYKTSFRSTLAKSTLDRINSTEEKHSAGYGLRVIKDGRVGFSFFTREEDFGKALSTALSTSRHSQKLDIHFSDTGRFPKVKGLFDKKVSEMEEGEMVDLVVSSIDMQKQPGIDLLENFLTRYVGETSIATSSGCFAEYSETLTQFQPIVKSGEEAIAQEEAQSHGMVDTRGLTARGIEAALRTRKSAKLEGEHAIYLHRYAIEELLGKLFAPLIDADDVARKQSAWHDKLGKAVASESLSVYDDPTIDDGISSMPFDAEATPARRRAV